MAGFLPTDLPTLRAWFDASSLLLPDNDPVSVWVASGGSASASIVGTPVPVYKAAAQNGRGVVRMTAGEGRIRGTMTDTAGVSTLLYVGRLTGAGHDRFLSGVYPPNNFLVGSHSSQSTFTTYTGSGFINSAVALDTAYHLFEYTETGGSGTFYLDGTNIGTTTGPAGLGAGFAFSGYDITTDAETVGCELAEFVVTYTVLADADRQLLEGYAAWKWGTNARLPADHPYKNIDPGASFTIAGVTRDSHGAPLGGVNVYAFRTSTNAYSGTTVSDGSGNYSVDVGHADEHYCVGYLDGSPDLTGATINTLTGV